MPAIRRETLTNLQADFGGYEWDAAEIGELTDPRRGIITGFADLLQDLRAIGRLPRPGLDAGDD